MKIMCIGCLLNTDVLVNAPPAILFLCPAEAKHFFSKAHRPAQGPSILLFKWYWKLFVGPVAQSV